MKRPTGCVTFLFTDIEGSTNLWEQHPELMAQAFARQEHIVRQAMLAHNGYVYKMIGDAFQVAFANADDALKAALEAQRVLQNEMWGEIGSIRVRMALHAGETEERADDYVGPLLNRVARLLNAGHGGQVLMTQVAYEMMCDRLPPDTGLRDMGEHQLKDLIRPEHIYQLVAAGLQESFPPLLTLDNHPNNLPLQPARLIGREKEIAEVKRLLSTTHLLTLTGSGGVGKTRLSLHIATDELYNFKDGIWLVELAPITDPALVPITVAAVLGLGAGAGRPIMEMLTNWLRNKQALLVLDNCEHLVDACAQFATAVLRVGREVRILATSREALGISGEMEYRVPTLDTLNPKEAISTETLMNSAAARLFVERATFALPSFVVTNANAAAVAQICFRVDGIPLAIELAAARVKTLKVEQIAARLAESFDLLAGGSRTALPRQQTLRALIDWSYHLLSDSERKLLRRLSVFVGGWTLETADAVCAGDGIESFDVVDVLWQLVSKSLVVVDESGEEMRYRSLETIRQYAHERLLESGEAYTIRTRHLDLFTKFAEEVEPKLRGAEQLNWLVRLDVEQDNLRAALEWSLGEGRVAKGVQIATTLNWFWDMRANWSEGLKWMESLLAQPEALPKTLIRARALYVAGNMSRWLGDMKKMRHYLTELIPIARAAGDEGKRVLALGLDSLGYNIFGDDAGAGATLVEEGLAIARSIGDAWLIGALLYTRGWLYRGKHDDPSALAVFEESLACFNSVGDQHWAAAVSFEISGVHFRAGDFARARREFASSLPFFRQAKLRQHVWRILNALGEVERAEGNYQLAKGYYEEGLEISREIGSKVEISVDCGNLGFAALDAGDIDYARTLFAESLSLGQDLNIKPHIAFALMGFASLAVVEKQAARAVQLFAVIHTLLESDDRRIITPADEAEYKRNLAVARAQLDDSKFDKAWSDGKQMTVPQAIGYALQTTL